MKFISLFAGLSLYITACGVTTDENGRTYGTQSQCQSESLTSKNQNIEVLRCHNPDYETSQTGVRNEFILVSCNGTPDDKLSNQERGACKESAAGMIGENDGLGLTIWGPWGWNGVN